jgi:serine/threonine protein kinase
MKELGKKLEKARVKEELDDIKGLERLGIGTARMVYRIKTDRYGSKYKGKVVKKAIPTPDNSAKKDNKREVQTWMTVKGNENMVKHFCPIREFAQDYSWLVMDYAKPVKFSGIRSKKKKHEIKKLIKFIREQKDLDIDNKNKDNIGMHKELGIVLIDYPYGAFFKPDSEQNKGVIDRITGLI